MRRHGGRGLRLRCGPAWSTGRQVGAKRLRVLVWQLGAGWWGARGALVVGLTVPLAVQWEGPRGGGWWPVLDVRWLVSGLALVAWWWGGWRRGRV